MNPDDERLGQLLRAIRRRQGLTQVTLAQAAGVPRGDIMRVEAGLAGGLALDRIRRIIDAAGGRARLGTWLNGAAADRILDERHAAVVERALALFVRRGWATRVEVSFSDYGDRGSIDLLAAHAQTRIAAVCEIKTEFGSLEETNRTLDVKVRLGAKIANAAFGWWPSGGVARLLIVPNSDSVRRVVRQHANTMQSLYPARGREVRAWLRDPAAPFGGIWFVSEVAHGDKISRTRSGKDAGVRKSRLLSEGARGGQ